MKCTYPVVNIESRQKLIEIVKTARGSMSKRAFGQLMGVSDTTVRLWENGKTVPDTEHLAKIAARSGHTLEELLSYLEGQPVSESSDLSQILRQIKYMPLNQVAMIGRAVADRFAQASESSGG